MEQNLQYFLWMKSKHLLNSHLQSSMNSYHPSWEEQAFAEDAAGPLGGFVWPPRSYSCTFCRREFRSAQALGGHMNVHRRDRARLKQSLGNESNPSSLSGSNLQYHSPDHQGNDSGSSPFSSSPNSSRASPAVTSQENSNEEPFVGSLFPSPTIGEHQRRRFPYSSSPSSPDNHSNTVRLLSISSSSSNPKTTTLGLGSRIHREDAVETDLSVGMKSYNEDISNVSSKRLKSSASFPIYHKPCSSDRFPFQYEVLRIKTSNSIDDIDLELRLGDAPAVK